jgi:hypothetical protein
VFSFLYITKYFAQLINMLLGLESYREILIKSLANRSNAKLLITDYDTLGSVSSTCAPALALLKYLP